MPGNAAGQVAPKKLGPLASYQLPDVHYCCSLISSADNAVDGTCGCVLALRAAFLQCAFV